MTNNPTAGFILKIKKLEDFSAQVKYGEDAWDNVRRLANIDTPTFSIHHVGQYRHAHLLHTPCRPI
jgi:hypothetical protein